MRDILILQLGRLGDLVQTLPLIRRCKEEHPGCRVTLLCLRGFHGILAESGGWDRLVTVSLEDTDALADPEAAAAFPSRPPFDGIPELHEEYDLVVNLISDLGSAVLCSRVRAARRLGRVHTYDGELRLLGPWAKYLFSLVGHRTENLFNLVDLQVGVAGLAPRPLPPCLPVSAERAGEARALLLAAGWKGGRPLVALQTGASDLHRAWDGDSFAALARRLLDDGAEVVLVGDAKEAERSAGIRAAAGPGVVDLAGKTGLSQLPAVVQACDLLVSNDTGTIHVAAAVGTPTLGLYFATAYYSETAPYGAGHAVLQVEIPCAPCNATTRCAVQSCREHLAVADVHAAARWMLRPGEAPPRLRPTLSLYRSRFLEDGTLLYAPVAGGAPSGHYLTGLLGRMVWESALGLPRDPVLHGIRRRVASAGPEGAPGEWARRRASLAESLEALAGPLRRGREIAGRLREAFAAGRAGLVHPLHEQLAGLGKELAGISARCGLIGSYLHFDMMDMDFAEYPALASRLEDKYRDLDAWLGRLRTALDGL